MIHDPSTIQIHAIIVPTNAHTVIKISLYTQLQYERPSYLFGRYIKQISISNSPSKRKYLDVNCMLNHTVQSYK
jgi:hypothetical protein